MESITAVSVDIDNALSGRNTFSSKLKLIHERIQSRYPLITRIDVALQDPDTDLLKLFSTSCTLIKCPPEIMASKMGKMKTLLSMDRGNKALLINDHAGGSQDIMVSSCHRSEFHSSLTVPFKANDRCGGFTSFNAQEKHYFTPTIIEQLHTYSQLITQLIANERQSIASLRSAVSAFLKLNNVNNAESPEHLQRVGDYSRLIAENAADRFSLSNEWIEHLYMFAPLHDIGKIFIPENILMKPGKLSEKEFKQVQLHPVRGREAIDNMIEAFNYKSDIHYTEMLRNIITYHHEAIDGSGYPKGLKGEEIPLEARIVAVADVLDALLTERPYKKAWTTDKALSVMQEMADQQKLDPEFVEILVANKEEILGVRQRIAA